MVNLIWALENQLGPQVLFETVDTQQRRTEILFPLYPISDRAESWEEEMTPSCMYEEKIYL